MGTKLDDILAQKLTSPGSQLSDEDVPVIVTLRPGTAVGDLGPLRVERSFESIAAASGKVRLCDLGELEALERVESIEFDGEVHAQESGSKVP